MGVYRTTPDGKIIEANPALAKILRYKDKNDLKDVNVKKLYVRQKDRALHLKKLQKSLIVFTEFQLQRKDGRRIWGRDFPCAVRGQKGRIEFYDGILVDITREKKAETGLKKALNELERSNRERQKMIKKLESLSLTDDLTKLYNRRGFFTVASEFLQLASRNNVQMFLLFMDLDNLKVINDTFGHHIGDAALVKLAEILAKTFRRSDIKGRMGGDEFAVFPIDTNLTGVESALSRLEKNLDSFNRESGEPFKLSISIGISRYDPAHPCSIDELLVRADKLMYEQKRLKQK